jgi:hypothetical protein
MSNLPTSSILPEYVYRPTWVREEPIWGYQSEILSEQRSDSRSLPSIDHQSTVESSADSLDTHIYQDIYAFICKNYDMKRMWTTKEVLDTIEHVASIKGVGMWMEVDPQSMNHKQNLAYYHNPTKSYSSDSESDSEY